MEFASPPRKEIIYGICFSSKKRNHLWNLLLLQEKKSPMEFASPPRKKSLWNYPSRIILKYFSPILSLDRILLELESR
jgi:hypothetical protein